MTIYKILVSREESGYITIKAENESQAIELIDSGDWSDDQYEGKEGHIEIINITALN